MNDFDEIYELLTSCCYVLSLKGRDIENKYSKIKKVNLSCIVNIFIPASSPASKMPKTPAKPSYSLVGDLHSI